jgi:hypothetical protein
MRHQFFEGLTGEGVETTLAELERANYKLVAAGHNEDGFWLIMLWVMG